MKTIKITLGDKLFGEIKKYLEGLPLDNADGKANDLMHIIAGNEITKEEIQERASKKVDQLGAEIMEECREHARMNREKKAEV